MTSTETARSSGVGHRKSSSKSSSSTISIITPTTSTPSGSPTTAMPVDVNGLSDNMEQTHVNGTTKEARRALMKRKASTPMMPAFMVSAPGKVIVFGEHAVVHGKVGHTSPLVVHLLIVGHRPPLQQRSLYDHISSSPLSQNQDAPSHCDFRTSAWPTLGILMTCHGKHFHTLPRKSTIMIWLRLSTRSCGQL
jgi:hypothetical protein